MSKNSRPRASELLRPDEAAEYIKLSKQTLYNYVHLGRVRAWKIGKNLRFRREDLDALITAKPGRRAKATA